MERQIFICEDSLDGIFTAVYDGWLTKSGHANVEIRVKEPENLELFCEYHKVSTDREKARKVTRTICMEFGQDSFEQIAYAAASIDSEKGTAIYQTLVQGLCGSGNSRILEKLSDPYVRQIAKLQLRVWHEVHHYMGFVRFREIQDHILYSSIEPENQILPLLEYHFTNRFPTENWVIYDQKRKQTLLHAAQRKAILVHGTDLQKKFQIPEEEEEYQTLWRSFCESIAIRERTNECLQRQNLPLRFRKHMTEFERL